MKKNGFFIIERFMVDDLKLKGNELIIYGIIYGFSKNNSSFEGSLNYLAGWIVSAIRDDYKLYNLDKNFKKIGEQTYKESELPNDNIELYKHMGFI